MVLDLNNFKAVNNSMDHHVGDALLREVSDRLVSRVRTEDLVARIGGDEFAFLVPGIVNRRQAEVFAKQVIGGFARPFMLANQHLYVTATMGITLCPYDGGDGDELLRNAEQALFVAKRQGRSLGTYSASMREEVSQRHQMQQDLAEAIKLAQLTMAYQPIWDNRSGRVAKLEALVRWYHPHWEQVSPADFIPLAEEAGLIQGLGALVLWQSCRDLARLQKSGFPDLQMSINRSTLEFQTIDPEANEWLRVIRHFDLDPADIIIEITESPVDGEQRSAQGADRCPARGGLQAGHRRLRHRLLGAQLPAHLPGGSGQDRQHPSCATSPSTSRTGCCWTASST